MYKKYNDYYKSIGHLLANLEKKRMKLSKLEIVARFVLVMLIGFLLCMVFYIIF